MALSCGNERGDWPWAGEPKGDAALFLLVGDIVKVTPTSKAVGDPALLLVTNGFQIAGHKGCT